MTHPCRFNTISSVLLSLLSTSFWMILENFFNFFLRSLQRVVNGGYTLSTIWFLQKIAYLLYCKYETFQFLNQSLNFWNFEKKLKKNSIVSNQEIKMHIFWADFGESCRGRSRVGGVLLKRSWAWKFVAPLWGRHTCRLFHKHLLQCVFSQIKKSKFANTFFGHTSEDEPTL